MLVTVDAQDSAGSGEVLSRIRSLGRLGTTVCLGRLCCPRKGLVVSESQRPTGIERHHSSESTLAALEGGDRPHVHVRRRLAGFLAAGRRRRDRNEGRAECTRLAGLTGI